MSAHSIYINAAAHEQILAISELLGCSPRAALTRVLDSAFAEETIGSLPCIPVGQAVGQTAWPTQIHVDASAVPSIIPGSDSRLRQ